MKVKIELLLVFIFLALQSENSTEQLLQQNERDRNLEQVYTKSIEDDVINAQDEENEEDEEDTNSESEIDAEKKEPNEESQNEQANPYLDPSE
jgi:hypothetical protein